MKKGEQKDSNKQNQEDDEAIVRLNRLKPTKCSATVEVDKSLHISPVVRE